MAKQSGLHQIKGKVGEHSYYRQTGVAGGLIRSINQGLSDRVKTDEAYVNTRLNNAEFGQACKVAAVLVRYITPKFRPMILPFSQSKMAKMILEHIKHDEADWGRRNFVDETGEKSAIALSSLAKNDFESFGLSLSAATGQRDAQILIDETILSEKLLAIGAEKLNIRVVAANSWVGDFNAQTGKYAQSYSRGQNNDFDRISPATGVIDLVDAVYPSNPPQGWPATGVKNVVVIIMPVRYVNDTPHILQEHCTFKCFEGVDL